MTVRSIHADPPPLFKNGDCVAYNELVERRPRHGFPSPMLPSPSAGSQIPHLGFPSPRSLPCPHVAAAWAWRLLAKPITLLSGSCQHPLRNPLCEPPIIREHLHRHCTQQGVMQHIHCEAATYGGSALLQKGHIPATLGEPVTTARPIRFALCAVLVLALLDLFAGFVWLGAGRAAAPKDVKSLKNALELHDAAYDGDQSALRPAIMALRRLRREDPWDALAAVYLGSAYAIAVRDGWFGSSRLVDVARSVHHLNAALDLAPNSFEVRMVRASVQSSLPRIFVHRGAAIEDAVVLDQMFRQIEDPPPAIASRMLPIYDFLAKAAPDRGDWAEGRRKASDVLKDA